jgi:hypothetical protein
MRLYCLSAELDKKGCPKQSQANKNKRFSHQIAEG